MTALQKWIIFVVTILIIISIYHDLVNGTAVNSTTVSQQTSTEENTTKKFHVVKVKVHAGDTVLSIAEEVNGSLETLDMKQIFDDFRLINHTDPHNIKTEEYYYFPLYSNR